jgi:hypothetical protein
MFCIWTAGAGRGHEVLANRLVAHPWNGMGHYSLAKELSRGSLALPTLSEIAARFRAVADAAVRPSEAKLDRRSLP